jgi:hypothetical protein
MSKKEKDDLSNIYFRIFLGLLGAVLGPFILLSKDTPKKDKITFIVIWLIGFIIIVYFLFLYPTSYLLAPKYYYLKNDFTDVLDEAKFDINEIKDFRKDPNKENRFLFKYQDNDFSMETIDGKKVFAIWIENSTFNPEPIYMESIQPRNVKLFLIDSSTKTKLQLKTYDKIRETHKDASFIGKQSTFKYGRRDLFYQLTGTYFIENNPEEEHSFIIEYKYNVDTTEYDTIWLSIDDENIIGTGTQAKEIPYVKKE